MANYRQIHVKIWKQDSWFLDLEPMEKLLFVYLFSNECTSVAGIYELPLKVVAFETGLAPQFITDALQRFESAGKVYYQDGVFWVVNLRKYNESRSPKVKTRIDNDIASIPDCELKQRYIQYHNGIDTVLIPGPELNSEHDHEQQQEHDNDSASASPPPKKPPRAPPGDLEPDTKASRMLMGMLQEEAHAKKRRGPKKFPSLACKQKFDTAAERLGDEIESAIKRACEVGALSVPKATDYVAKWNIGPNKPKGGTVEHRDGKRRAKVGN